jgi:hypothetical protein
VKRKEVRAQQLTFGRMYGERAKGGGRKKSRESGVSHLKREEINEKTPAHVTARIEEGLPSLRDRGVMRVIWKAFREGRERAGRRKDGKFRLVHYAILGNHAHLVVEALDRDSLSRGLPGLFVRMAKGLNRHWGRKGGVFADRYHARVLRSPREVHNVLKASLGTRRSTAWRIGKADRMPTAWGCGSPVGGTTCTTAGWRRRGQWRGR